MKTRNLVRKIFDGEAIDLNATLDAIKNRKADFSLNIEAAHRFLDSIDVSCPPGIGVAFCAAVHAEKRRVPQQQLVQAHGFHPHTRVLPQAAHIIPRHGITTKQRHASGAFRAGCAQARALKAAGALQAAAV